MKTHRTLIRVEKVRTDRLDAVIPGWAPEQMVTIPLGAIDPAVIDHITDHSYLLGDVNIGAATATELVFTNVNEIVPDDDRYVPEGLR